MKVIVTLVVEVNPKKWADNTNWPEGVYPNVPAKDIRDDVRAYVFNAADQLAMFEDTDARVTLRT